MASDLVIAVTVLYSPAARQVHEVQLSLPCGSTVLQAVRVSGLTLLFPALDLSTVPLGVWGRKVSLDHPLRENDRVEIYRPLTVDPKVARRERFARQGARTAGLFSKKRLGAKSGY